MSESKGKSAAPAARRTRAVESFGCAKATIGDVVPGMSLFAITRGQWSMIDAVLHVLDQVGPAAVSLWTWTVAEYEVDMMNRLRSDGRLTDGMLVIDRAIRHKDVSRNEQSKNVNVIRDWKAAFGDESVRYSMNHAKIATVASASGMRCLLRGSMNLNFNPRFEQFDITEGGEDYDLVKRIEGELPVLADGFTQEQVTAATKLEAAFTSEQMSLFTGLKVWKK